MHYLYSLMGENEAALYTVICYIEVPFRAGLTVIHYFYWPLINKM